ncbi:hypothetical protein R7V41_02595 [Mesomycoplasma ovipneumoniae]|uniref:Transmembrane protein n=1 Tax=Mesomycoplasma ovipneumoniae TaxID=29562 RepID=A0AAJ2P9X1_9BACT|nr:hypothetical protein [Mesomycoplasma ovipneumoniae]MDW2906494.1 hypothetical protein [Mesomycoplasma ovipneumoniae]MDW2914398.1 hypothetical protein [Mesomycoplasma ovipneumoniae]
MNLWLTTVLEVEIVGREDIVLVGLWRAGVVRIGIVDSIVWTLLIGLGVTFSGKGSIFSIFGVTICGLTGFSIFSLGVSTFGGTKTVFATGELNAVSFGWFFEIIEGAWVE